jgi:hypothetical protein
MNRGRVGLQSLYNAAVTILVVAAAMLSGCGGGGSSTPPNLSSAPGAATLNAYYQASHQSTLNASASGNNFSLTLNFTPNAGTTMFEGSTVGSATETLSLSQNGVLVTNDIQTVYYTVNPFVPYGSVRSNGTEYAVEQSYSPLSTTITVGQTGPLATSTTYHDSTKAQIDGTQTTTFAVHTDTPTTLQFCTNAVLSANTGNPDGLVSGTETDCYRVNTAGNATLFSITVSVNGNVLTFQ